MRVMFSSHIKKKMCSLHQREENNVCLHLRGWKKSLDEKTVTNPILTGKKKF